MNGTSVLSNMKTDMWMPLFIGEFVQQTLHLTRPEQASYLLLLMAYWTGGEPLRDEGDRLRIICRCSCEEWPATKALLSRLFLIEPGGLWRHPRLDLELEKAARHRQQRRSAGKSGAARRWSQDGRAMPKPSLVANGMAEPLAVSMASPSQKTAAEATQPVAVSEGPEGCSAEKTAQASADAALPPTSPTAKGMAAEWRPPSPLPVPLQNGTKEREKCFLEVPPMTREVYEGMAKAKGISRECYEYHWNACEGRGWVDTHGNPIRNPVSLLANFARHWRPKECSRKPVQSRTPVLSDVELLRQAQQ